MTVEEVNKMFNYYNQLSECVDQVLKEHKFLNLFSESIIYSFLEKFNNDDLFLLKHYIIWRRIFNDNDINKLCRDNLLVLILENMMSIRQKNNSLNRN